MLRGMYTATAGMLSQQRKHDTVTNNIANINTPGFKMSRMVSRSFPEMLIALTEGESLGAPRTSMGRLNTGVLAEEALTVNVQGDLRETGSPFDFALVSDIQVEGLQFNNGKTITEDGERIFQPQAFFTVLNADGEQRYTRNGKLTVDSAGQLVTAEGFRVAGLDGEPIVLIHPDTGNPIPNVTVNRRGQILDSVDGRNILDAAGQPITLLISRVEEPLRLIAEGSGVLRNDETAPSAIAPINPTDNVQVRQGFIERSNVDPTQATVDLMTATRMYEANQKMVQYYDRSLEMAVNDVGRV
ncbi:flagellar hook-basal body protein [Paenibacillus koleovorans]|uniref:flagellar hook-basal body protein n=1 Tax=Paenibacillus koleovorans TaxID=121608 RepID=UPI000FD7E486|nr:flagellar hook-basal body protein [Paenibacillus koleovorans]